MPQFARNTSLTLLELHLGAAELAILGLSSQATLGQMPAMTCLVNSPSITTDQCTDAQLRSIGAQFTAFLTKCLLTLM